MTDHVAGDIQLVENARRGDRAAMVALYQRYVHEVYGYLLNQVGDPHDAEDLTSETFLRLVKGLHGFEGRSSFRTWIYEIARNQLRDHWRRNGRHPAAVELNGASLRGLATPGLEESIGPSRLDEPVSRTGLEIDERAGQVPADSGSDDRSRAILEALPDRYRRVLELRIMEGRSVRHTAEEMGISEANVKVMTHRALKRAEGIATRLGGMNGD